MGASGEGGGCKPIFSSRGHLSNKVDSFCGSELSTVSKT